MEHQRLMRQLFAILKYANITDRDQRMCVIRSVLHRDVYSCTQLSTIELQGVVDTLGYWKRQDMLKRYCDEALAKEHNEHAG